MPIGGKREGAGRKKGIPNKKTAAKIKAIEDSGLTPLEYLLSILRNEKSDPKERIDAAKAAAPYVHPRLTQTEISGALGIFEHETALDELDEEGET